MWTCNYVQRKVCVRATMKFYTNSQSCKGVFVAFCTSHFRGISSIWESWVTQIIWTCPKTLCPPPHTHTYCSFQLKQKKSASLKTHCPVPPYLSKHLKWKNNHLNQSFIFLMLLFGPPIPPNYLKWKIKKKYFQALPLKLIAQLVVWSPHAALVPPQPRQHRPISQ